KTARHAAKQTAASSATSPAASTASSNTDRQSRLDRHRSITCPGERPGLSSARPAAATVQARPAAATVQASRSTRERGSAAADSAAPIKADLEKVGEGRLDPRRQLVGPRTALDHI